MKVLFSCGAILFRKEAGKILYLLLDTGNRWDLPKGLREENENEEEVVIREVFEETGIKDLKFLDFKRKVSFMFKVDGQLVAKEVVLILAQTKEKEVKVSFEHKAFKWCGYEEVIELIKFKNYQDTIRRANDYLEKYL
ncbi:MAG: NUDIX domain-containing protein [Candidatus Nanoarchaeia archaeon]